MPTHPKFNQGDVVLVPFPFADLTGHKVRPAVVVSADSQGSELILAFVTSVLTNRSSRGAEIELRSNDPEFQITGLKTDSLLRLDKLVTVEESTIPRRLGKLGPKTKGQLGAGLRRSFGI